MKKILFSLLICFGFIVKAQTTEVTFYTSKGNFVLEIYDSLKPITAGNFLSLVDSNFYDGIIFHRVIGNFMIQGGDPTGTGYGGPGYSIDDEFHPSLSNIKKTISMANAGPNTGGSQFFINLKNNTHLDYNKSPYTSKHPVFGKVIDNFAVVENIGAVNTNLNDKPLVPVVIDSIRRTHTFLNSIELEEMQIKVSSNPVNLNSYLTINTLNTSALKIKLFAIDGKLIAVKRLENTKNNSKVYLKDLFTTLNKGTYFLQISDRNKINKTLKLIY